MSKYRRPEFKRNRIIIPLILLLAIFTLACPPNCPPNCPPPERERVVLIFSDVTSSLLQSESEQVGTLTCDVLDSLPPGTQYRVYPIQIEGQKLEPMDEGTIVVNQIPGTTHAVNQARRKKISDEIKKLYELIKPVRRADADGKPDNHTCILYTLKFAQNIFKQFDEKNTDFDLIYVSDMIEQCNTTPMGKPISLGQANTSEEIKLAKETNLNLDLSHARVSMIIPATDATYTASGRPNPSDLQAFWEAILLHCGFSEDSLKNSQKFYFSSGLPRYLKSEGN
ncbi:MAG TPA: hypothetical protein VGO56_10785 [Pyrinomonadaceae bacterium]|jgi:hypothetical protein|nr:hypothetical protein [Pyrinomonadaceae bacterium]